MRGVGGGRTIREGLREGMRALIATPRLLDYWFDDADAAARAQLVATLAALDVDAQIGDGLAQFPEVLPFIGILAGEIETEEQYVGQYLGGERDADGLHWVEIIGDTQRASASVEVWALNADSVEMLREVIRRLTIAFVRDADTLGVQRLSARWERLEPLEDEAARPLYRQVCWLSWSEQVAATRLYGPGVVPPVTIALHDPTTGDEDDV